MDNFLFWFLLVGVLVAVFQDIKRREIDNWVCAILMVGSFVYILSSVIFFGGVEKVFVFGFLVLIGYMVSVLFYNGRVFAGGDANLLMSMTGFFVSINLFNSIISFGIFILLLMFSGAVYGLVYTLVLFSMNFGKVRKDFFKDLSKWYFGLIFGLGIFLLLLSMMNFMFIGFGVFFVLFPLVYVFGKRLEKVSMIRLVSPNKLTEGDWLAEDVQIGKNVIKSEWDGLSKKDIKLLRKRGKKVKVKYGLQFAPAFLIALILYYFRNYLIGLVL